MNDRISSKEFTEWMAYAQLEPFGEERADLRSGIVASVIANANRDPKKQRTPFKPTDFMPFLEKEEPAADTVFNKFVAMFGGKTDGDPGET